MIQKQNLKSQNKMTTKLIQTSNIKDIKAISDNIDVIERLDPYIIEAQDLDIRPFLGEPLFYDIVSTFMDTPNNYQILLNGGDYINNDNHTLYFDGLKVATAYFAYARFISNQGINITRYGIVKKMNENSEAVDAATVDRLAGNARSIGLAYLNQVETFLDDDYSKTTRAYPLWKEEESKKPTTKYRITKVQNY
jgi:hypothetical protein